MSNKALFAGCLWLAMHAALAVPIAGRSDGSFSNLNYCDSSGSDRDCRIVATTANGTNTQVRWGSTSQNTDFINPSRLTAVDIVINEQTDALGVAIARLDWYSRATLRLNSSLDQFAFKWTPNLRFTAPSWPDPNGSEVFDLTGFPRAPGAPLCGES